MAKRIGTAILWALGGYIAGALAGLAIVSSFSSNTFDRSIEEVMTGAFVTGPLGAVIAFLAGFVRGRRTPPVL